MVKAKIKMYKLEDGKLVEAPNVIRAMVKFIQIQVKKYCVNLVINRWL